MAVFRCKMCAGALDVQEGQTTAVCPYCGTAQTLPKLDDQERANLYDRANHFRRNNEYDKAAGLYERILNEDPDDAEAYWSLVLCRYGVEYVEDPATHKRVPTVNRTQLTSIFDDENYKAALEHAIGYQRTLYEEEAQAINEIQKGILAISQQEEPFDVFICYKETDPSGNRTPDSVLAQELYEELTEDGFKVFFSRITLEDKLGVAYEPYIFAALHSARVMVVVGTKAEYFNAPWVKNEWSRYLALIQQGEEKTLIPAYRDMDPYDLPEEFSHLQAQDMSKLGFMQDLTRGIKKILQEDEPRPEAVPMGGGNGTYISLDSLVKRAFLALEDGDFTRGDEFCEQVLNLDPENAQAYVGKLMAERKVTRREQLKNQQSPLDTSGNYQKALRFGNPALQAELKAAGEQTKYNYALMRMNTAQNAQDYELAATAFASISSFSDAKEKMQACLDRAESARKAAVFADALTLQNADTIQALEQAAALYESIPGWGEADLRAKACRMRLQQLQALAQEAKAAAEKQKKRRTRIKMIVAAVLAASVVLFFTVNMIIIPNHYYKLGVELLEAGDEEGAFSAFLSANGYRKSEEYLVDLWNQFAVRPTISAGGKYTAAVKSDGDVVYIGNGKSGRLDSQRWSDIVAVSVGYDHIVGLCSDGTVAAWGENDNGQCDVSSWKNIVSIATGSSCTFGLKADGTVRVVGETFGDAGKVSDWQNIVALDSSGSHTVGLKTDGTVVASGFSYNQACDVSNWTDIVAIATGRSHTVGLKSDGTVVAVGDNSDGQCDVKMWRGIVAIAAGDDHTVGLKANGTVVAVGDDLYGECEVSDWTDIVAIAAGDSHTVGLKSDGTVVAVGYQRDNRCKVSDWTDIRLPNRVEK